jgi:hypothetical protein
VQAIGVVNVLDKVADVLTRLAQAPVGGRIDFLGLQRLDEAFGFGVVVGIIGAAHARADAVNVEPLGIAGADRCMSPVGPKAKCRHVRSLVAIGGKAGPDSRPARDQNELTTSNVTQRDDEKLETLTAPNPRPLFVRWIENNLVSQCGNGFRRLVHNHPSGDPAPSQADITMTQAIVEVAKPLGISVHDHIIVGKDGHASLKGLRLI